MADPSEIAEKERRVREFLQSRSLDGALFSKQSYFSWMTCGQDNHVQLAGERGSSTLLITKDAKYVLADRIEAQRMMTEEGLKQQDFELVTYEWHRGNPLAEARRLCPGPLVSDLGTSGEHPDLAPQLDRLRWSLTPQEVDRYREAGRLAGQAMQAACLNVEAGQSEHEIAALLASEITARGMITQVLLVAADERIFQYRHPVPTGKRLEKYAMLVIGARKWGLVVSLTRFVHFGAVPDELRRKQIAAARVDAAFITHTKPGAKVGEVLKRGLRAYAETGYPDEWQLHHQGGPTGYEARSYRAIPGDEHEVQASQAFAWNPSITGAKSEDTIIAFLERPQIISPTPDLPSLDVEYEGTALVRPDVLVR